MSNPLKDLEALGQSPWYDNISRSMLDAGKLKRLIDEDGLKGVTSNPSIFDQAISGSADYDSVIQEAVDNGISDPEKIFEALAIRDIRDACDELRRVYDATKGADGFVSLEVSPQLAHDAERTTQAGKRLFKEVDRRNLMIKVPATAECLPSISELIASGINVNVTLIFSLARYRQVMEAFLKGMETTARPRDVASVASFFVSRIDAAVDKKLPRDSQLRGKIAIANAKLAYKAFQEVFTTDRWKKIAAKGGRVQRPLWASTSTKDPKYPDTLYLDSLIGPDTVNTIPPATWAAFKDHGTAKRTLDEGVSQAEKQMEALKTAGVDLAAVTAELEKAGVASFAKSFQSMLDHLAAKAGTLLKKKSPPSSVALHQVVARLWASDAGLWKSEAAHRSIIHNSLGWLRMPQVMPDRLPEIQKFADEIRKEGFEHAAVLGMGGSSLAPEVLRRSFGQADGFPTLHVLDSTDPEAIAALESAAPPETTLFIIASKSGGTVEPNRMLDYFFAKVKESKGEQAGQNFIAITDPGSPLVDKANELKFHRVFLNFADIGGRYSALSYFGLVPAALAGAPVEALLKSAKTMAEACAPDAEDNPGAQLGAALAQYAEKGRDKLTLLLPPAIESFGLWLEQLIAESTGKEGRGIVPIALEPTRAAANYAKDRVFVRYVLEGREDPFKLLSVDLEKKGHPVLTLHLDGREDLGGEFFRWMIAAAILGQRLGINPFDQPDVQAAKEKTKSLMAELNKHGDLPPMEAHAHDDGVDLTFSSAALGHVGKDKGLFEAVAAFIAGSHSGDYAAFLPYLNPDGSFASEIIRCRKALAQSTHLAVQAGYGPRYLHSTGQLHKGGADNGLFVLVSRSDGREMEIPGAGHSFAQLIRAQAIGDFSALEEAGRRAVLVKIKGDVKQALAKLAQAFEAGAKVAKV